MELDKSLFDLTYRNKYAVWDLSRRDIFGEVNRILLSKQKLISHKIKPIDKYKNFLKKIYNITISFILGFQKARILVITFRRFKKRKKYFDYVVDPICENLKNCFYLDFANSSFFNSIFFDKKKLFSFKVIREDYDDINIISKKIDRSIKEFFKIEFYSKDIINYNLNVFFSGKKFFNNLLNKLNCQYVIYSDDGTLKCLAYVCKKKRITCCEIQHGASPGSIMWSYPQKKKVFLTNKNCYYPNYFLLWGNYWKKIYNLPSKFLTVGTYHYIEKISHKNSILFISNKSNYTYLKNLTEYIAKALPKRKIYFKLHPEQIDNYNEIKKEFEFLNNVRVILDEVNELRLLKASSDFITIRSTLAYKALQSGCRGHILKKDNYYWDRELIKFTNLFSNAEELLESLNKNSQKDPLPIFFEKINTNLINHFV